MEDRAKLALEALIREHEKAVGYFRQHVASNPDCETCKLIAALSAPEEPRAAGDWEDELLRLEQISKELLEFAGDFRDDSEAQNKIEAWSVEICNWTEAGISQKLRRGLSASRQVVPRGAIRDVLSEGQVPIDVYITADAFEILIDAIRQQLPDVEVKT